MRRLQVREEEEEDGNARSSALEPRRSFNRSDRRRERTHSRLRQDCAVDSAGPRAALAAATSRRPAASWSSRSSRWRAGELQRRPRWASGPRWAAAPPAAWARPSCATGGPWERRAASAVGGDDGEGRGARARLGRRSRWELLVGRGVRRAVRRAGREGGRPGEDETSSSGRCGRAVGLELALRCVGGRAGGLGGRRARRVGRARELEARRWTGRGGKPGAGRGRRARAQRRRRRFARPRSLEREVDQPPDAPRRPRGEGGRRPAPPRARRARLRIDLVAAAIQARRRAVVAQSWTLRGARSGHDRRLRGALSEEPADGRRSLGSRRAALAHLLAASSPSRSPAPAAAHEPSSLASHTDPSHDRARPPPAPRRPRLRPRTPAAQHGSSSPSRLMPSRVQPECRHLQ